MMNRYGFFYSPRFLLNNKIRLFSSVIFFLLLIFLIRFRTPLPTNSPHKLLNLLDHQKILVPVSIKHLYDYQVVCPDKNNADLIPQLNQTCQIHFQGHINVTLSPPDDFQIDSLSTNTYLKRWQTTNACSLDQNETLAIVIPYRDRKENLRNILYNLILLLQRQKISNYRIFVIEQQTTGAFNKGRLLNIAFEHLRKTSRPTCVIFHDVDLLPENDQNLYSCLGLTDQPIHMSANVRSRLNGAYTTIYPFLVGGVLKIRPDIFVILNGYSNKYFNWGGEDDDMGLRFLSKDICVQRPKDGFYYAHSHSLQTRNNNRFKLLFDAVLRQDTDGLTNINQLAVIAHVDEYPLISWITVQWKDQISQ